jgi:hypothetical protein
MRKSLILCAAVLISFSPRLSAETIFPFVMPNARAAAIGGSHAALSDDFYSLFSNPASFLETEGIFNTVELTVSTFGPVFEIIDLLIAHSETWDDLDLSPVTGAHGFAAGLDFGGPVSVGWVGKGLGLGIFTRMKSDATVSGLQLRPVVSAELLMVGGYSFRVLEKGSGILDLGFLGKGFFRTGLNFSSSILTAQKMFDNAWERPFTTVLGLGFDFGLKYTFAKTFSAALVCFDTYTPAVVTTYASMESFKNKDVPLEPGHYATVKPRLDLGFKYRLSSTFLDKYISNINILLDYHDFLDLGSILPRNPILNIGLGVEVVVLEKLSLRVGIADSLPAAGFGLDLTFMQFDCSIHGKELALDPGVHSVYAVDFALHFRR